MKSICKFFLIPYSLAVLFACASESSNPENLLLGESLLPSSTFYIDGKKDTILTGERGIQIHIPAHAFLKKDGSPYHQPVALQLLEAPSLEEMIKGNLTTLSNDTLMLESSGVFKVDLLEKDVQINPKAKIRITVPYVIKPNSSLYYGQLSADQQLNWVLAQTLEKDSSNYWLMKGRELFHTNCTSCHNADLVSDMTGPSLAWVTKRWDKFEDLASFTRNSIKFSESGNLRARYMIDWSASAMTNFDFSPQEMKALYDYIEEACIVKGIDSTKFGKTPITKDYQQHIQTQDSLEALNPPNSVLVLNGTTIAIRGGWYNIDRWMKLENVTLVDWIVRIREETYKGKSTVKLILPERNVIIHAHYNKTGDYYTFLKDSPKIRLPLNEKAFIMVITKLDKEPRFALKELIIKNSQTTTLSLNKKTAQEIMTIIENTF